MLRKVQHDTKLLDDNEKVLISERSGWRFDSRCEIFPELYSMEKIKNPYHCIGGVFVKVLILNH